MNDQFFAKLREIQKKERANSSLARVGTDFYKKTHLYLDSIREIALNDPFSEENDLLKNVQRIATEICELREHKIANSAVINIHRSYHLFEGKPKFDLVDSTPLNITEEEETLYFSFMDVLKNHRRTISLDNFTDDDETRGNNKSNDNGEGINNGNPINNKDAHYKSSNGDLKNNSHKNNNKNNNIIDNDVNINNKVVDREDQVLNRLNKIKSGKVIEDEVYESIEKQIEKSKYSKNDTNKKTDYSKIEDDTKVKTNIAEVNSKKINDNEVKNIAKSNIAEVNSKKINDKKNSNIKSTDNNTLNNRSKPSNIIGNEDEQFVDLDYMNQDIDYNFDDNSQNRNNSKSTIDKIANVMVLIFSEINSIIGVDKKVYGPFKPQDIVIMPDVNAEILVKNKKGRFIKV